MNGKKRIQKQFNDKLTAFLPYPYKLDGYVELSDGRQIAFEYNGKQHYEHIEHFQPTIEFFEKRVRDDKEKKKRCIEKNINLIIIPFNKAKTDEQLLKSIRKELSEFGVLTEDVKDVGLFFEDFYKSCPKMKRLKKIVEDKGGTLLTNHYHGDKTPMKVDCGKGHEFPTQPG